MPEIVISFAIWLDNIIRTHREEILAVATAIIALYTIILACIGSLGRTKISPIRSARLRGRRYGRG